MFNKLVLIASLLQCVTAHRTFQMKIPNGGNVPHPCKPNYMWQGVGHFIDEGTGLRNPFGEDFAAAGFQWTSSLCQKDSDGDGLTNGQELGDPNCEWKENAIPKRLDGLSHPGICDPWDSPECFKRPMNHPQYATQEDWMRDMCQPDEFVCEGVDAPEIRNVTVRLPPTQVPAKETTYMCQIYDLSSEGPGDYHMIAVEPIINNSYVVHHIVLFGCTDDAEATGPYECGMSASEKCLDFLSVWTVGIAGECYHPSMGVRLGINGYKRVAMQFHWNNPEKRSDWVDSSGLKLIYTPNRRTYDAGMLMVGSDFFYLPPGQKEVEVKGTCTSGCTKQRWSGPISITMAWNHMHYAGKKMNIEVVRNGEHLMYLTNDPVYSYDSPQMYMYNPQPVELLPGDEIISTCTFDTYTRNRTTYQGDATSDEMCFGFLTYYPKQNMEDSFCLNAFGISYCDAESYSECPQLYHFWDPTAIQEMELYKEVMMYCRNFAPCTTECLNTLYKYKQTDPCLNDNYWEYLQTRVLVVHNYGREFLGRVASCNVELHMKLNPPSTGNTGKSMQGDGNSSPAIHMSASLTLIMLLMARVIALVRQ